MASVPGLLPLPPASTRVVEPCGGRSGIGVRARGWRRAVGRRAAVTLVGPDLAVLGLADRALSELADPLLADHADPALSELALAEPALAEPAGVAHLVRRPAPTFPTAPLVCAGIAFPARSVAGHAAVALAVASVGSRVAGPDRARRCSLPVTAGLVEAA